MVRQGKQSSRRLVAADGQWLAETVRESARERRGTGNAYLLAENGAHPKLERVPGTRDPQARPQVDPSRENRITRQCAVDVPRDRIQIEEPANAGHNARKANRVFQAPKTQQQGVTSRRRRDFQNSCPIAVDPN